MRTRAEKRHHRDRLIKKRMSIIRNVWGDYGPDSWPDHPGSLAKYNLCCSCTMCKMCRETARLPRRVERQKMRVELRKEYGGR